MMVLVISFEELRKNEDVFGNVDIGAIPDVFRPHM